ncbi:hypothetical protein DSO57_1039084 [Entomophthora muscae]|uniref:Uncharacterized protein n=1 Tax=Entomophthora muscae TaxID=34485 RepID=A0ACC2RPJ4_9FUNG|nr:hypothetical protein DSO57_1039084 [Entomophthora muscae]
MYPVRGEKDPQVTIIPESLNLLTPGPPLPQPPSHSFLLLPPQILAIFPVSPPETAPTLDLLSTVLHDVLVAQHLWLRCFGPSAQSCS